MGAVKDQEVEYTLGKLTFSLSLSLKQFQLFSCTVWYVRNFHITLKVVDISSHIFVGISFLFRNERGVDRF